MRVVFDIEEKLALGNAHRCDTLNELLEQSDAVTLHVDGRKSNTGFFGEDQFAHMKQDAIFINLSRGFVADLGRSEAAPRFRPSVWRGGRRVPR